MLSSSSTSISSIAGIYQARDLRKRLLFKGAVLEGLFFGCRDAEKAWVHLAEANRLQKLSTEHDENHDEQLLKVRAFLSGDVLLYCCISPERVSHCHLQTQCRMIPKSCPTVLYNCEG